MEDLQEVARLILLQVDYNRECGKDDKFTKDEIADIINRRVVKKLNKPAVISSVCPICDKIDINKCIYRGDKCSICIK